MLTEKITTWAHAYCFAVLELLLNFIGRTHAVVGIGVTMLAVVGVDALFGRWGNLALFVLVIGPAGAAMVKMIVDCLVLSKRR
jgi:hypothetical protein